MTINSNYMEKEHPLETLREIRTLMERSSRFISLSGLSGIVAGIMALLGAAAAYHYLGWTPLEGQRTGYATGLWGLSPLAFFILDAGLVLLGALAGAIYFTTRKARRKGLPIWDALTRRLLFNLALPLAVGGIFVAGLWFRGLPALIAPSMLVFYGLALINASKYTLHDVLYLGLGEVVLGLLALFFAGYGLEFWALGFGLLHIIYGAVMFYKYER